MAESNSKYLKESEFQALNVYEKFMYYLNDFLEGFFDPRDCYMADVIAPLGITEKDGILTFPDGKKYRIDLMPIEMENRNERLMRMRKALARHDLEYLEEFFDERHYMVKRRLQKLVLQKDEKEYLIQPTKIDSTFDYVLIDRNDNKVLAEFNGGFGPRSFEDQISTMITEKNLNWMIDED